MVAVAAWRASMRPRHQHSVSTETGRGVSSCADGQTRRLEERVYYHRHQCRFNNNLIFLVDIKTKRPPLMTMSALLDSLFPEYKFHGDVFEDVLL